MWISKKKYEEFKDQFNNLSEKIDENKETIFELQRIIEHYVPGKVTYITSKELNVKTYGGNTVTIPSFTHFYKDGKEYQINELYLHNRPNIEVKNDNENILYIEDEYIQKDKAVTICCEYIVDLQNQTFIRTK